MRLTRILLILVAVVCFGVALSYPIRYRLAQNENNSNMDELSALRSATLQDDETEENIAEALPEGAPETGAASGAEDDGVEAIAEGAVDAPADEDPWADDEAEPGEDEAGVPAMPTRPMIAPTDGAEPAEPSAENEPDESAEPEASAEHDEAGPTAAAQETAAAALPEPTPIQAPGPEPLLDDFITWLPVRRAKSLSAPTETPEPSPTPNRREYTGPLAYTMKEKVALDKSQMLPELREIYALNNDLVGWITIPGTVIDYPVVQCQDSDYYLEHDFYGNANINGQIILDTLCDPYTPSYNLIISGHHMKNGSMFGDLPEYRTLGYWEKHKLIEFDSLMFRKQYVIFAAFYSADYDEDEEGFRYNADIQYRIDAKQWLREIKENELYDTGIDVQFGDEFITLTTCNRARHRNGRFVVVARKVREGETFE